jgi:hypothetical protein
VGAFTELVLPKARVDLCEMVNCVSLAVKNWQAIYSAALHSRLSNPGHRRPRHPVWLLASWHSSCLVGAFTELVLPKARVDLCEMVNCVSLAVKNISTWPLMTVAR